MKSLQVDEVHPKGGACYSESNAAQAGVAREDSRKE